MTSQDRYRNNQICSIRENAIYIENCKLEKDAEAVLDLLIEYYSEDEHAIHHFLTSPKVDFSGKSALDIINKREGQILIRDHICRLKTGNLA